MLRFFEFTWKENKRYNNIIRKNHIVIETTSNDIGVAAHLATNVFCKNFGNLKKIEIIEIQEKDKNGDNIGEVIKPAGDSSIIPTAR